jgi:hypothetical protein
MDFKNVDELKKRLRKRPWETVLIGLFILIVGCVAIYISGFVSEKARLEASKNEVKKNERSIMDFQNYNVDELIKVKIISRRFGSKFAFDVPPDIKIWAFKDIIVNKLNLPRKESVRSLGISVEFIYTLYSESLLKDNITLREAGIKNDDILQMKIDISISDPMVQDLEKELSGMDGIVFQKPPEDWYERKDKLRREIDKRKQKLYNQYSEKILEKEF